MATTPDPPGDVFLHSDGTPCGFFDSVRVNLRTLESVAPTVGLSKCTDSQPVTPDNNTWREIGVWSMAPQA